MGKLWETEGRKVMGLPSSDHTFDNGRQAAKMCTPNRCVSTGDIVRIVQLAPIWVKLFCYRFSTSCPATAQNNFVLA